MNSTFIALENVRVATPCRADWNKMTGDNQARFCQSCQKNVYNLSSLTREQAEALIQEKEGKLCVRFYQREDGTVLTSDCPIGMTPPRKRTFSTAMIAMLLAPLLTMGALAMSNGNKTAFVDSMRQTPVIGSLIEFVSPQRLVMGYSIIQK